jgi:uncharacterized membrane protein YccC
VVGHPAVELVLLFACLFLAYYFLRIVYGVMVLAFTLMLANLYALLGRFDAHLLVLRLTETLVGCVLGTVVAAVLLPARARLRFPPALAGLLRELAALIGAAVGEGAQGRTLRGDLRQLDQRLRALEELARPTLAGVPRVVVSAQARQLHFARAAVRFGRLFALAATRVHDPAALEPLRTAVAPIAEQARALAAMVEGTGAFAGGASRDPLPPMIIRRPQDWLERLSDALQALATSTPVRA